MSTSEKYRIPNWIAKAFGSVLLLVLGNVFMPAAAADDLDTYVVWVAGNNAGTVTRNGAEIEVPEGACGMLWRRPEAWYWAYENLAPLPAFEAPNNEYIPDPADDYGEWLGFEIWFNGTLPGCPNLPFYFATPYNWDGDTNASPPWTASALVIQEGISQNFADILFEFIGDDLQPDPTPEPPSVPSLQSPDWCEIAPSICYPEEEYDLECIELGLPPEECKWPDLPEPKTYPLVDLGYQAAQLEYRVSQMLLQLGREIEIGTGRKVSDRLRNLAEEAGRAQELVREVAPVFRRLRTDTEGAIPETGHGPLIRQAFDAAELALGAGAAIADRCNRSLESLSRTGASPRYSALLNVSNHCAAAAVNLDRFRRAGQLLAPWAETRAPQ